MRPPEVEAQHEVVDCAICGANLTHFRWTDTHGVGACQNCGAPYRILHYKDDKRVDKSAELLIAEQWREKIKAYWDECHQNVAPGAFNFPDSSYEVATNDDVRSIKEWFGRNGVPA